MELVNNISSEEINSKGDILVSFISKSELALIISIIFFLITPFKQPEVKGGVKILEPLTIKIFPFKNYVTSLLSFSKTQLSNSFSLA